MCPIQVESPVDWYPELKNYISLMILDSHENNALRYWTLFHLNTQTLSETLHNLSSRQHVMRWSLNRLGCIVIRLGAGRSGLRFPLDVRIYLFFLKRPEWL
jgi:hypothetical protein